MTDQSPGAWDTRLDELLFDGETVTSKHRFGANTVVVTSHRVLVFTPETDDANLRYVDRPNVDGVEVGRDASTVWLERAVKPGVVGSVFLAVGMTVRFDGLLSVPDVGDAGVAGLGALLGIVEATVTVLDFLDDAMRVAGALAVIVGVAMFAMYWRSRTPVLVIAVAGDDDLVIPVTSTEVDTTALERALAPRSNP